MAAFFLLLVVACFGSVALVGVLATLFRRIQSLEAGPGGEALKGLQDEVESLRAELEVANDTLMRLEDRVDFTEKLLGPRSDESAS